jgi:hypothetical protein
MAFYTYWRSADRRGYHIRFHYQKNLVEAIKRIPSAVRSWDPAEKIWYVDNAYIQDACRYLDEAVYDVTAKAGPHGRDTTPEGDAGDDWDDAFDDEDEEEEAPRKHPYEREFTALHLRCDAPAPVIDAVYRALALICHPDRGGEHRRMVEINLAYEKVKKFVQEK